MKESAAIVGAGISGLCTALALSRQGISVDLIERDIPPPDGDAEQAFFSWQRRGAAQFRHPHAFLGLMCSILEQRYPDLLEEFFSAGARRLSFAELVPPKLRQQYQPADGDEEIWMLLCRRATIETVLRDYVQRQPNVAISNTCYVTGIQTDRDAEGRLSVTGLETTDRANSNRKDFVRADIYIDATGRSSKFRQWLCAAGANIEEQVDDAEIVYYTRHY